MKRGMQPRARLRRREWITVWAMFCVRGPSSSTGRSLVRGSRASQRKTYLGGAAEPGANFVQLQVLEVLEVQVAEAALMEELSVPARAIQPGGDGGLSVPEDTLRSGRV